MSYACHKTPSPTPGPTPDDNDGQCGVAMPFCISFLPSSTITTTTTTASRTTTTIQKVNYKNKIMYTHSEKKGHTADLAGQVKWQPLQSANLHFTP